MKDQLRGERPPDDGLIDPAYSAFCDVNDELIAQEIVARDWIKSLRLPRCVLWIDDALGAYPNDVAMIYDPDKRTWREM